MREIKFRAWHEENKAFEYMDIQQIWMNGVDCTIHGAYSMNDVDEYQMKKSDIKPRSFVPNANWEQYTGLKDKNGKDWYEGDKTDIEDDTFAVVVFEEGTFCFKWYEVCERGRHEYIETCPMTHYHYDHMQIDGNIHEDSQ